MDTYTTVPPSVDDTNLDPEALLSRALASVHEASAFVISYQNSVRIDDSYFACELEAIADTIDDTRFRLERLVTPELWFPYYETYREEGSGDAFLMADAAQ